MVTGYIFEVIRLVTGYICEVTRIVTGYRLVADTYRLVVALTRSTVAGGRRIF